MTLSLERNLTFKQHSKSYEDITKAKIRKTHSSDPCFGGATNVSSILIA